MKSVIAGFNCSRYPLMKMHEHCERKFRLGRRIGFCSRVHTTKGLEEREKKKEKKVSSDGLFGLAITGQSGSRNGHHDNNKWDQRPKKNKKKTKNNSADRF